MRQPESEMFRQVTVQASVNLTRLSPGWSRSLIRAGEPKESFKKVQFVSAFDGCAVADGGGIVKTTDGGKRWTRRPVSLPIGAYVRDMWMSSSEKLWLLIQKTPEDYLDYQGSESRVIQTTDSGRTWSVKFGGASLELQTIFFESENVAWIVGGRRTKRKVLQSDIVVMRSTDRGQYWEDLSQSINQTLGIPPESDAVVAVCQSSGGGIALLTARRKLILSGAGSIWRQILELSGEREQTVMHRLGESTDGLFWVAGGADSIEGQWGLLGWMDSRNSVVRVRVPGVFFKDVVSLSGGKFLACGAIGAGPGGHREGIVLYTKDQGKNWSVVFREATVPSINCLSTLDNRNIWACGDYGTLLKLTAPTF